MKYCAKCYSEYRDEVASCSDCGSTQLIAGESPLEKSEVKPQAHPEQDTRKFVLVGSVDDPLSSQEVQAALKAAGIPVFVRNRSESPVDAMTRGTVVPWFEFMVPEELADRANAVVTEVRQRIEVEGEENSRLAEEEERLTEER